MFLGFINISELYEIAILWVKMGRMVFSTSLCFWWSNLPFSQGPHNYCETSPLHSCEKQSLVSTSLSHSFRWGTWGIDGFNDKANITERSLKELRMEARNPGILFTCSRNKLSFHCVGNFSIFTWVSILMYYYSPFSPLNMGNQMVYEWFLWSTNYFYLLLNFSENYWWLKHHIT